MSQSIPIGPPLSLNDIGSVANERQAVTVPEDVLERIGAARKRVEEHLGRDKPLVYGINTGFGALAEVRIDAAQIRQLQLNLVRSHACGVGEPLDTATVRAVMLLRAQTLAQGYSGCRTEVVDQIAQCLDAKTGRMQWRTRLKGPFKASPIAADGRILFASTTGVCTVIAAGRKLRQLAANPLDDQIIASPAIANGTIYLRGRKRLYAIRTGSDNTSK